MNDMKNKTTLYIANGAMIAAQGYYEFLAGTRAGSDLNAYATMDLNAAYHA